MIRLFKCNTNYIVPAVISAFEALVTLTQKDFEQKTLRLTHFIEAAAVELREICEELKK